MNVIQMIRGLKIYVRAGNPQIAKKKKKGYQSTLSLFSNATTRKLTTPPIFGPSRLDRLPTWAFAAAVPFSNPAAA
jgi:hypothetical protein